MTPTREKPLARLARSAVTWADQLSLLLAVSGLLGLLLLPLADRGAKFDEKALLVGGAAPTFNSGASSPAGLQLAAAAHAHQYQVAPNTSLAQVVAHHMERLGLEVHLTHMCAPGTVRGRSAMHPCVHVHGTWRASQTDGTESLLVVTPIALTRGDVEGHPNDYDAPSQGGILLLAAMQSLMHHLRHVQWLSRDIVWVVPDARCGATASLQHWADVQLGEASAAGHAQSHGRPSPGHQGSFGLPQQALVLQADGIAVNALKVLVEGFDGQLPKLDTYLILKELVWVVPNLVMQPPDTSATITAITNAVASWVQDPSIKRHMHKLNTMTSFMWRQAVGLPTGPHAALKAHMVDAATARFISLDSQGRPLSSSPPPRPGSTPPALPRELEVNAVHLARYAELVLRSLNNLDERFHHSFFLYLLTDVQRFVAVEMYMVPLVMLIMVIVLKAAKQRQMLQPQQASSHAAPVKNASVAFVPGPDDGCVQGQEKSTVSKVVSKGEPGTKVESSQVTEEVPDKVQQPADKQQIAAASRDDIASDNVTTDGWLQAIAIGVFCVLVSLVLGLVGRGMACSSCLTCQYPHGDQCCFSPLGSAGVDVVHREGTCGREDCDLDKVGHGGAMVWAWDRLLPGGLGVHMHGYSVVQGLMLIVNSLVVVCTLGWQGLMLVCRPVTSNTAPGVAGDVRDGLDSTRSGRLVARGGQARLRLLAQVRVVLLSASAVMLTGMASVNWALGYCVAALLVVMLVTSPTQAVALAAHQAQQQKQTQKRMGMVAVHAFALVMASPMVVLGGLVWSMPMPMQGHGDGDTRGAQGGALGMMIQHVQGSLVSLTCCSWFNTHMFVWLAYCPCWVSEAVWCILTLP